MSLIVVVALIFLLIFVVEESGSTFDSVDSGVKGFATLSFFLGFASYTRCSDTDIDRFCALRSKASLDRGIILLQILID